MPRPSSPKPARWLVLAAFAMIYLIWGSSYIFIHFAIQTIPPFIMASVRFICAGGGLFLWMRARGVPAPTRKQWGVAAVAGLLFFGINNGALVWAEQIVPSGMAALLIGGTPAFIVLFDWWRPGGKRPHWPVFVGLALGILGIVLLIDPKQAAPGGPGIWAGALALVIGSMAWAAGSIYIRHVDLPKNALMSTATQLFLGGLILGLIAIVSGEPAHFNVAAVAPIAIAGTVYLAVFSSLIAFSAYVWLLRVSTPARVATYGYVNPVIAVILGWALANESITLRTLIAGAIILGSVLVINSARHAEHQPIDEPLPGLAMSADAPAE